MKNILFTILLTMLLKSIVFSNVTEPSVYDMTEEIQEIETLESNELNLTEENIFISQSFEIDPNEKRIFLNFEKFPKNIYNGQIFPVKMKAIIAIKDFDDIHTSFEGEENLTILNKDSKWQWYSDNIFYNIFYMKTSTAEAKLPNINVEVKNGFDLIESASIESQTPNIINITGDEKYTNVIAESLHVKKFKTSRFDDERLIMVLELEATYSNLKSFHMKNVLKAGIDSSYEDFPHQRIFYYAIFENFKKEISFSYFNLKTNNFEKITLPVVLKADDVSTQSGLNPKESEFTFYKSVVIGVLFFLFLTLFFIKSKIRYLLIALLLGGYFIYENNPLGTLKIKNNTNLRILPTQKSTIFYKTDRILYVERLGKREKFIKVILPNNKIGWIKESDVITH